MSAYPTLSKREGNYIQMGLLHLRNEHKDNKILQDALCLLENKFAIPDEFYGVSADYDTISEAEIRYIRNAKIKRRIYDSSAYYPEEDEVHEFYIIRHIPD